MGWSSGYRVFDPVAGMLEPFLEDDGDCDFQELAEDVLYTLINSLKEADWDTESDSAYYDHPVIGLMLGNTFEDEDE